MDTLFIGQRSRFWSSTNIDAHSLDRRFSVDHGFEKPNDERALRLMDAAARHVMKTYPEVAMAFGESDEFRHVYRNNSLHLKGLS